ncbi:hypothetical protein MP228_004791 [Amoeboaphelidium protococcarum]|nr:hypothetical protein MP228_004791 [Amoeboaphelidium protococcarum]
MNKPGVDSDQSSGKDKQYSIPQLLSLNKDGVRSQRLYQVPHDKDDDNQHLNNNGGDVSQQSSGSQFSQSYHHRQQQQQQPQQQFQPQQVGVGRMRGGPPGLKKLPPGFSAAPPGIPAPAQRHFRQKTAPQAGESSANHWLPQQHQQQRDGDNDGYGLQQDQHRQQQQQQQPDVFDMEKFKAEMRKMSGLPAAPQSSYSDDTLQQQQLGTQYPLQDQAVQFNHDDYVNSVEDVIFQSDLLELPADEADGEQVGNLVAPEQGLRQSRFGGRFFNLDASVTTDTTSSAQSSSSVNQQQQFTEDQGLQTSSQPASAGKRTPPPSLSSTKRKGSSTSSINVPTSVLKRLGTATSSLQSSPQPSSPLKSVGKKQKKKQQQELQQKESVSGQQVDASSKTVTLQDGQMKAKAGKQQDNNNAAVKQPLRKQAYANEGTRYVQKDFVIKDLQLAQELDVNSNFVVQMPPPLPLMPVIPGLPSPTALPNAPVPPPLIVDGQPVLPPPPHILALLIYQSGQPVPEPLLQFLQPPFIQPEQLLQFRPSLPVSPIAMSGTVGLQQQQQQQQLPLQQQYNGGDSSPTFGQQQPNNESSNPLQKWFGNVSGKLQNAPVDTRASKEVLHVEDIEQQQQHL